MSTFRGSWALLRDILIGIAGVVAIELALSSLLREDVGDAVFASLPFLLGTVLWMAGRAPIVATAAWGLPLTLIGMSAWSVGGGGGTMIYAGAASLVALLTFWPRATAWWVERWRSGKE
jgi:hypothetical protein